MSRTIASLAQLRVRSPLGAWAAQELPARVHEYRPRDLAALLTALPALGHPLDAPTSAGVRRGGGKGACRGGRAVAGTLCRDGGSGRMG